MPTLHFSLTTDHWQLFKAENPGLYEKWDKAGILRSKVRGKNDLTIHQEKT